MKKLEFIKFHSLVGGFFLSLRSQLGNEKAIEETMLSPLDWKSAKPILQIVAEELMLSRNGDEAIARLKQDQSRAITVLTMAIRVSPDQLTQVERRAYEKSPEISPSLPCLPVAFFLLELIDWLETQPI